MFNFFLLLILALTVGMTGCLEYDDTSSGPKTQNSSMTPESENNSDPENTAEGDELERGSAEQAEWDAIRWFTARGPSAQGARQVMTLDGTISNDGQFINFAWDRYPWNGAGLGHFFVWDGSRWVGGKFEWIRAGGQSVKQTENIRGGYNGLSQPASGSRVAFAWTNAQGTERSNLVITTWP